MNLSNKLNDQTIPSNRRPNEEKFNGKSMGHQHYIHGKLK